MACAEPLRPGRRDRLPGSGRNILILRAFASDFRKSAAPEGTALMAPRNPPLWAPNVHAERRPFLLARAAIMRELRDFFAELEFIEVETAALQVSPGNETHVHAFKTELVEPGQRDRRFLRTSPEFACKKLLAAGERRIVEFARVFRNRERGPLHHPEFTLIEWYRAHGRYELLMDDCMAVIARAAETVGTRQFSYRDRIADPFAEPERLTVAEAFAQFADIDLRAVPHAAVSTTGNSPPRPPTSACTSPPTTPGATCSAAC